MSDGDHGRQFKYCQDCGQQLRSAAEFCDRCGAAADTGNTPAGQESTPPEQQRQRHRHPPQQPPQQQSGSSRLLIRILKIGAMVLGVLFISIIVAGFVLGIGDAENQEAAEEVTTDFFQTFSNGNTPAALQLVHSSGPLAEELSDGTGGVYITPDGEQYSAVGSTMVEQSDGRMLVDIEIEVNEFGSEPYTRTVRTELRTENGEWRIWKFPE